MIEMVKKDSETIDYLVKEIKEAAYWLERLSRAIHEFNLPGAKKPDKGFIERKAQHYNEHKGNIIKLAEKLKGEQDE